jgi:hypothetical protein
MLKLLSSTKYLLRSEIVDSSKDDFNLKVINIAVYVKLGGPDSFPAYYSMFSNATSLCFRKDGVIQMPHIGLGEVLTAHGMTQYEIPAASPWARAVEALVSIVSLLKVGLTCAILRSSIRIMI